MPELLYNISMSLDGYIADEQGDFGWTAPSPEVHAFVNDLLRPVSTFLFGRRIYETMAVWETLDTQVPAMRDFAAIWHGTDKVVYSSTLAAPTTARTRVVRRFDPDEVREMKARAPGALAIGGPTLAGQALAAGLIDDIHLFVVPIVIGGGLPAWPRGVRQPLALVDERRFASGTVSLRYRPA
jgi:dihydrofolate reductase